jgi:hypothetical protein
MHDASAFDRDLAKLIVALRTEQKHNPREEKTE